MTNTFAVWLSFFWGSIRSFPRSWICLEFGSSHFLGCCMRFLTWNQGAFTSARFLIILVFSRIELYSSINVQLLNIMALIVFLISWSLYNLKCIISSLKNCLLEDEVWLQLFTVSQLTPANHFLYLCTGLTPFFKGTNKFLSNIIRLPDAQKVINWHSKQRLRLRFVNKLSSYHQSSLGVLMYNMAGCKCHSDNWPSQMMTRWLLDIVNPLIGSSPLTLCLL